MSPKFQLQEAMLLSEWSVKLVAAPTQGVLLVKLAVGALEFCIMMVSMVKVHKAPLFPTVVMVTA